MLEVATNNFFTIREHAHTHTHTKHTDSYSYAKQQTPTVLATEGVTVKLYNTTL